MRLLASSILVVALVIALAGPERAHAADGFDFSQTDKQLHVATGYGVCLTSTVLLRHWEVPRWRAVLIASLATLALGTFKETALDDQYSPGDQVANVIGVATSAAVVFTFNF